MAAAERALALDSSNAAAMSRLASARALRNDLSPHTEALARRGTAQEPGVESGIALARVLAYMGRVDEGLAVIREAAGRDSLAPMAWAGAAVMLAETRHFVEIARAWERALALRTSAKDGLTLESVRRLARLETGDGAGSGR